MRIILLRHGATDWNLQGRCQGRSDLHLNDSGLQQARAVALSLREEKIDAIYSSDLKRACQTAEMIQSRRGLQITIDPSFRELDHGEFEGLTFPEIRARYPEFIAQWRERPAQLTLPGGESLAQVDARAWQAVERLARRHLEENVLVVTHSFPILTILCRITGTPLNAYRSFHVDPCGLTRVEYAPEQGWSLLEVHDPDPPPRHAKERSNDDAGAGAITPKRLGDFLD